MTIETLSPMGDKTSEIELFAEFVANLTLENGRPMVLEPFQRTMFADYFAGVTETLILISKKNGKSSSVGALALFHLCSTPDAEAVIAAASRDQASIMLRQAAGFVRRSEWLRSRLHVKQREIVHRELGGRLRVAAADTDTLDGWLGSLALVDELGRHRSSELYGVLRDGLGPRDGQMISISTAGNDRESPLGLLHTKASRLPVQKRDGAYRYARSADRSFAMHEWALDAGQDLDDLDLVRQANPASWQTLERLRERHDSPSTTPWQWARFACGVWVRGEFSAIQPQEWDALETPGSQIPPGSRIVVGLDLAWQGRDSTAVVPVWYASESRRVVGDPTILQASDGVLVDDRDVKAAILELAKRYQVQGVAFDPAGGAVIAQQLERDHGLTMIAHSQSNSAMALADGRLLLAIRQRQLEHSGHEVLRQHVLNAVTKSVGGDLFRFERPRHGPRIPTDALTALSIAHSVAVTEANAPKPPSRDWYLIG